MSLDIHSKAQRKSNVHWLRLQKCVESPTTPLIKFLYPLQCLFLHIAKHLKLKTPVFTTTHKMIKHITVFALLPEVVSWTCLQACTWRAFQASIKTILLYNITEISPWQKLPWVTTTTCYEFILIKNSSIKMHKHAFLNAPTHSLKFKQTLHATMNRLPKLDQLKTSKTKCWKHLH